MLPAYVVARAHGEDLARLGATDVSVDGDGITATFGTDRQAQVAHEIVNDAFTPEVDGTTTPVPFRIVPTPADDAYVGWTDAANAIIELAGVTAVQPLDTLGLLHVGTTDAKSAARIDALLRDRILGLDVIVEEQGSGDPSRARGWGDGIG